MSHATLEAGGIHIVYNAAYTDRATREAATYGAGDIGKVVRQTDENSYWIVLTSGAGSATFAKASVKYGERSDITGNSATVIWTFTMPDESSLWVDAVIHAMQDSAAEQCAYGIAGLFYRDGGGAATQQGSTIVRFTPIESDATPSVEFNVSGNDVRIRWTGVTAETWQVIPLVEVNLNPA